MLFGWFCNIFSGISFPSTCKFLPCTSVQENVLFQAWPSKTSRLLTRMITVFGSSSLLIYFYFFFIVVLFSCGTSFLISFIQDTYPGKKKNDLCISIRYSSKVYTRWLQISFVTLTSNCLWYICSTWRNFVSFCSFITLIPTFDYPEYEAYKHGILRTLAQLVLVCKTYPCRSLCLFWYLPCLKKKRGNHFFSPSKRGYSTSLYV